MCSLSFYYQGSWTSLVKECLMNIETVVKHLDQAARMCYQVNQCYCYTIEAWDGSQKNCLRARTKQTCPTVIMGYRKTHKHKSLEFNKNAVQNSCCTSVLRHFHVFHQVIPTSERLTRITWIETVLGPIHHDGRPNSQSPCLRHSKTWARRNRGYSKMG